MHRGAPWSAALIPLAAIALAGGCNDILHNDPFTLGQDGGVDATSPDAAQDANNPPPDSGHPDGGNGSDAGADAASDAADCPNEGIRCNGTCTVTSSDAQNCGSCGHDCAGLPHVTGAGATCSASKCVIPPSACAPGYAHCSSNADDGCETDITTATQCGACGAACPSSAPLCQANASGGYGCVTGCSGSTPTLCGTTCVDTTKDPNHCSNCQTACPSPPLGGKATCSSSQCGIQCNSAYHQCGTSAVCASDTDATKCGPTCASCQVPPSNGSATCSNATCGVSCNGGYHQCGTSAACAGDTDATKCGSSCVFCTPPASNGTATCSSGACGISCSGGYHQCGTTAVCAGDTDATRCGPSCTACTIPTNGYATCGNNQCGIGCNSPYSACGSACFNLQTDGSNCGQCGHSCQGGACIGGQCQPIVLATVPANTAARMASDASYVYWTTSDGAQRCAKSGCNQTPTTVVSGRSYLRRAVVDAVSIYWGETSLGGNATFKCPLSGCAGNPITLIGDSADQLAVDGTNVYYGLVVDATAFRCSVNGCASHSTVGVGSAAVDDVATDGSFVYFSAGGLYKCAPSGGCGAPLVSQAQAPIAVGGGTVYFQQSLGTIAACSSSGCGGSPATVASGLNTVRSAVADATNVFWETGDGIVASCGVPCSAPHVYTTGQGLPQNGPSIAVDATFVYWLNINGSMMSVMRVAR